MALINKKPVTERETASYKLDRSTIELVKSYSEFIGSPQEHVVNEALRYIFHRDKDFNEWLRANDRQDLFAVGTDQPADKPKGRTRSAGGGGSSVNGAAGSGG